jgi:hypothetical protein
MTWFEPQAAGQRSLKALLLPVAALGIFAAGCGSSDDSSGTATQVTLPTITAPGASTSTTTAGVQPAQQGDKRNSQSVSSQSAAKTGKQANDAAGNSDTAKAAGGGSTGSGGKAISGPSDAQKAKNPGAYGGGSSSSGGATDKQKAGS